MSWNQTLSARPRKVALTCANVVRTIESTVRTASDLSQIGTSREKLVAKDCSAEAACWAAAPGPSPRGWVARFRAGRSLLSFDTSTVAVGHRSFRAARGARSLLLTERARAAGSQSPDISSALIAAKSALSFSSSWGYAGASSFIASRMIEKVEMWENHLWLAGTTCHGA